MANQLGIVFAKLDCTPRWRERLPELAIPALVVHGRRDPLFPVGNGEALTREIPGARLLVLERGATAIPDVAADEVAATMLAPSGAHGAGGPNKDKHLSGLAHGRDDSLIGGTCPDLVFLGGAGEGNRTLMTSLEGWGSTIELRPRARWPACRQESTDSVPASGA